MIHVHPIPILCLVFGLLISCLAARGQFSKDDCSVQIVRLKFDDTFKPNGEQVNTRVLLLAKSTDVILINNTDITKFSIQTDTICCTYPGYMYVTYHQFELIEKAAVRLAGLEIPLCCGVPVALKIDDKEIYRAMLWNSLSSFGNKSVTMTLVENDLIITNQLPNVPGYVNDILVSKYSGIRCLLNH
jgi:hypothetical protein